MKSSQRCKPLVAALRGQLKQHFRRILTVESLEQRTVLAAGIAVEGQLLLAALLPPVQ